MSPFHWTAEGGVLRDEALDDLRGTSVMQFPQNKFIHTVAWPKTTLKVKGVPPDRLRHPAREGGGPPTLRVPVGDPEGMSKLQVEVHDSIIENVYSLLENVVLLILFLVLRCWLLGASCCWGHGTLDSFRQSTHTFPQGQEHLHALFRTTLCPRTFCRIGITRLGNGSKVCNFQLPGLVPLKSSCIRIP